MMQRPECIVYSIQISKLITRVLQIAMSKSFRLQRFSLKGEKKSGKIWTNTRSSGVSGFRSEWERTIAL
jgi:hypothetical protein